MKNSSSKAKLIRIDNSSKSKTTINNKPISQPSPSVRLSSNKNPPSPSPRPILTESLQTLNKLNETVTPKRSTSNIVQVIPDNDLSDTLNKLNFNIIDQISIQCGEDILCEYLKASTKGYICFIKLDVDGMVPTDNILSPMIKSEETSNDIPYSIKIGSYECIKNKSCIGIIFECQSGMCLVKSKDKSIQPIEENYIFTNNKDTSSICSSNIGYPVILYSNLINDPKTVSENIETISIEINRVIFGNMDQCMSDMMSSLNDVTQVVEGYYTFYTSTAKKISTTLNELTSMYEEYEETPPTTDTEMDNFKTIQYNIRKRQELSHELVRISETFSSYFNKISHISNQLKDFTEFNSKQFEGIDGIMNE